MKETQYWSNIPSLRLTLQPLKPAHHGIVPLLYNLSQPGAVSDAGFVGKT